MIKISPVFCGGILVADTFNLLAGKKSKEDIPQLAVGGFILDKFYPVVFAVKS
jgi:hypothetical protein